MHPNARVLPTLRLDEKEERRRQLVLSVAREAHQHVRRQLHSVALHRRPAAQLDGEAALGPSHVSDLRSRDLKLTSPHSPLTSQILSYLTYLSSHSAPSHSLGFIPTYLPYFPWIILPYLPPLSLDSPTCSIGSQSHRAAIF